MAAGRLVHQQPFTGGAMVPPRLTADVPLLPWERQLAAALEISEEEYCAFVREVQRKPWARPAEYAHIPDVVNIPVPVLISLAIGIAFSAASYFLTPKPKQLAAADSRDASTSIELASITGRNRYSPSFGFDSLQDLAQYGTSVPIVFTRRDENIGSGGVLISPQLIWSRNTSWGAFQVAQIMLLAGQGPMQRPDLSGIYIGNNSLDPVYSSAFQFYWAGGFAADSRLRGNTLRFGTLSTPPLPAASEEAFTAPTRNANAEAAFCGAFSPQNQTQFGVFSGIPNGTPYRPNWEIVSVLAESPFNAQTQAITNQGKFVDEAQASEHPFGGTRGAGTLAGMPGTGRNYSTHIGIVSHNNYSVPNPANLVNPFGYRTWSAAVTEERTVNVGDTIQLRISAARQSISPIPRNRANDTPVDLTDVRSATESALQQYDESLFVGATFMIGRSTWRVTAREGNPYDPISPENVTITLQCMETWSREFNRIGLVAPAVIDEQNWIPFPADVRETWYPLLRYSIGHITNNRDCDVTELGIKSQVWARFNGLTNFNTVPNARTLADYNARSVQVREGKNQSYGTRTSFFALDIRPSENEAIRSLPNQGWAPSPFFFAVTGSTPQDIYSFIRIKHPRRGQYEFRLRPLPSTVFAEQGAVRIFQLNGGFTPYQEWPWTSSMGQFTIGARGRFIEAADLPRLYTHPQMAAKPDELGSLRFGESRDTGEPQSVSLGGVFSNVDNRAADWKKISNILSVQVGEDPFVTQRAPGYRRTFENWEFNRDGFYVRMRLTLECFRQDLAGTVIAGRNLWWRIVDTVPLASTGFWSAGQRFNKNAADAAGEQWRFEYTVNNTRQEFIQFSRPAANTRVWETHSAIAEVSHYGDLITRSCDQGPEHEVTYVNESLAEDNGIPEYANCAVAGLKLQASNAFSSLDQIRVYMRNGIEVERLNDNSEGPSNLLTDLLWYMVTNTDTGVGSIVDSSLIDRNQLVQTGTYLRANQLFFDDVISSPVNLRSWLAEKAPSMLCYVAIRNGQLSLNPALPQTAGGQISNTTPVPISALFTDGNIIEDSFSLEWLSNEERQMFQAAVRYRVSPLNQFPEQRTLIVRYNEDGTEDLPLEEFDLPHITTARHATLCARYFLAIRRRVTHSVTFRTLPYGLALAPGNWIRVAVEMSPYSPINNGIVRPDGTIVSTTTLEDGEHAVWSWTRGQQAVQREVLRVQNGEAQNLRNSLFSIRVNRNALQVYQVEAIEMDNEGIVTIKASNFPVDVDGVSLIARDVLDDSAFVTIGA